MAEVTGSVSASIANNLLAVAEDELINVVAKAGYNTQYEEEWDDLHENSIERALWRETAINMLAAGILYWRDKEDGKIS